MFCCCFPLDTDTPVQFLSSFSLCAFVQKVDYAQHETKQNDAVPEGATKSVPRTSGQGICQPKIRLKKHFSELPGDIASQSLAIDRVASEAPDN